MTAHAPFEPTRRAGLARMRAFVPRMGAHYAAHRNHDHGPDERGNVSNLSPWIRRRLVLESEVASAALAEHGPRAAEKFVQEVVWRTYWKGWLEQRSQVWDEYRRELADDLAALERFRDQRARYETAIEGRTGIEPFDRWVEELRTTGTLHNHARMWFASIWVFTLGLSWRLGADLFLRHLLDGDPAANTLSWRWVAGLHTSGKHYLANAGNIAKFTGGRFRVPDGVLANAARPAEWAPVERRPLPALAPVAARTPAVLLVTEEDCLPETLDLPPLAGAVLVRTAEGRSPGETAPSVLAFEHGALDDVAVRLEAAGTPVLATVEPAEAEEALRAADALQIVGAELPVGPARDALAPVLARLEADAIAWRPLRRRWDALFWPHATAGFFKLKKAIPSVLAKLEHEGVADAGKAA